MRKVIVRISTGAVILAFLGIVQTASAISYRFWQTGWAGGGVLTGSFTLDESASPGAPGLIGDWALTSFQAHWSGDANTQPYDWGINSHFEIFVWSIDRHHILDMILGMPGDPVYCDTSLRVFWDWRSTSIPNWPPGDPDPYMYRIEYQANGLQGQVVPDGGSSALLLGIVLAGIAGVAGMRRRGLAACRQ